MCENCGKEYKNPIKTSRWCSLSCYWEYRRDNPEEYYQKLQKKEKIELTCLTCGNMYYVHPYRKDVSLYCSDSCKLSSKSGTSLFQKNVFAYISGIYRGSIQFNCCVKGDDYKLFPDILINNKIIVECQGDYWHCNPKIYKEAYYHVISNCYAKDIWDKDELKKEIYESLGYKVSYVWENEWYSNTDYIKKYLKEIINEVCKD